MERKGGVEREREHRGVRGGKGGEGSLVGRCLYLGG